MREINQTDLFGWSLETSGMFEMQSNHDKEDMEAVSKSEVDEVFHSNERIV